MTNDCALRIQYFRALVGVYENTQFLRPNYTASHRYHLDLSSYNVREKFRGGNYFAFLTDVGTV